MTRTTRVKRAAFFDALNFYGVKVPPEAHMYTGRPKEKSYSPEIEDAKWKDGVSSAFDANAEMDVSTSPEPAMKNQ